MDDGGLEPHPENWNAHAPCVLYVYTHLDPARHLRDCRDSILVCWYPIQSVDSPIYTIAHAHPPRWPRLCVQLLAAMAFQHFPSVILLDSFMPKRFPTVSTAPGSHACAYFRMGFAACPFLPAYSRSASVSVGSSTSLTEQQTSIYRPFERICVCNNAKELAWLDCHETFGTSLTET